MSRWGRGSYHRWGRLALRQKACRKKDCSQYEVQPCVGAVIDGDAKQRIAAEETQHAEDKRNGSDYLEPQRRPGPGQEANHKEHRPENEVYNVVRRVSLEEGMCPHQRVNHKPAKANEEKDDTKDNGKRFSHTYP